MIGLALFLGGIVVGAVTTMILAAVVSGPRDSGA